MVHRAVAKKPVEEPSSLVFKSTIDEKKIGKRTFEMGLSNDPKPSGSNSEELCSYEKKLEKSLPLSRSLKKLPLD